MMANQQNQTCISKIFKIFPDGMMLEGDGKILLPDERGNFESLLRDCHRYEVIGDTLAVSTASSTPSSSSAGVNAYAYKLPDATPVRPIKGVSYKNSKWKCPSKQGNLHKPPAVNLSSQIEWTKSIEIYQVTSSKELKKLFNFSLILTPLTATITLISVQVSYEVFEGRNVVL